VHQEAAGAGDAGDHLGEVGGAAGWQGFQGRRLDAERGLAAAVAPGDQLVDEATPVVDAVEVAGAAQDQGLVEGGLEVAVVGLDRAVLVRLAGIVAAGRHFVVGAERLVAPGDVLGGGAVEIAVGGREAAGAMLERDAAQGPEGVLQVLGQGGEALAAEHDSGVLPAAIGQDEMVEPVREGLAGDGDAEVRGIGEVGQRHPAGRWHLAEDDVPLLAVQGAPVAHPPLQGPSDAIIGEGVRVGHLQMAQQGDGLHRRIVLQDRQQQRLPDRGERIGNRAAALGPALGGQAGGGLDPASGALTEARPGGGGALATTTSVLHVGSHLLVGDGFARHVGTSA
jgi:hypothetical protein